MMFQLTHVTQNSQNITKPVIFMTPAIFGEAHKICIATKCHACYMYLLLSLIPISVSYQAVERITYLIPNSGVLWLVDSKWRCENYGDA